jgi:hypothetical protein
MSTAELAAAATPEKPFYWKTSQRPEDPHRGFWQVSVSEGWRQMVLCTDMYETYADWLIGIIQGRPLPDSQQVTRPLTGLDRVAAAIRRARGGPAAPGVQGYA